MGLSGNMGLVGVRSFSGSSDCLNASGFWTPRLRGYIGLKGLLAPFLLIDNFLDVIIGWVIFNATLFIASYGMRPSGTIADTHLTHIP